MKKKYTLFLRKDGFWNSLYGGFRSIDYEFIEKAYEVVDKY